MFDYNADGDRVRMRVMKDNRSLLTRYYIDNEYELDAEKGVERLYLNGDAYDAPAIYVKENGEWKVYYICRDYQGSITHIANADGTLKQELSYDAWGRLRHPQSQEIYEQGKEPDLFLGRGYTGHEHLPWFGLINMNARLYDPMLGRFLSPDPYVQMPDFTQNFNRYSYCLNNPLKYTDPTGEWFLVDDIIAAIVGGSINLVTGFIGGDIHNLGQAACYFGAGCAGGVVSLYAGPIVGAVVLGGGNSIINQVYNNGWNSINWCAVLGSSISSGLTAWVGGQLTPLIATPIEKLTSSITIPVLKKMGSNILTHATSGFIISAGFAISADLALGNELYFEDILEAGGQGALNGIAIGAITGIQEGIDYARRHKRNPWTGEETHAHHSFPKFLGGEKRQHLSEITKSRPKNLHKELNLMLKEIKSQDGNDMMPRKGNPRRSIQNNFSKPIRFNTIKNFYDSHPFKYWDIRYDFYKNNNLRWTPW